MGMPDTILFRDEEEALRLYDVALMCEPDVPIGSVVMAHSLVNSAPLIAGMTEPETRLKLARYVYKISRGLIGQDVGQRTDVSRLFVVWSCWMVQVSTALRKHLGKIISRTRSWRQLHQIHVLTPCFGVRRYGHQLPPS